MKGSMFRALEEMVIERYGKEKWENSLIQVNLPREHRFSIQENVSDEFWEGLIKAVSIITTQSPEKVQEEFSDYWIKTYTEKMYAAFYMGVNTTREFLKRLDFVHVGITRNMKNATPPRFNYEWISGKEVIMSYESERSLLSLAIEHIRSLDEKLGCKTTIVQLDEYRLRLIFDK